VPSVRNTSSNPRQNFPITVADEEASGPALLAEHQEQVAGLLGDPGGVGIGGHPGQVDPTGAQFDEEQHVQPAQRGADCGCRDAFPKPEQLALDPLVAPARVLAGQADDQVLQLLAERRSPGCAVRVGSGAGDQPPMPAQQRLRLDEEARPAGAG
jgi:hypothetical protein